MRSVTKVIFALPNMSSGGAERVVSILANNMSRKNISVEIWLYYGFSLHYPLDSSVRIAFLDLSNLSTVNRISAIHNRLRDEKKTKERIVFVPFLSAILKVSVIANLGIGIPLVACERNNPYIHGSKLHQRLWAQIPFLRADHCVFQTPDARAYYSLVSDNKCSVITNPIPKSSYSWNGSASPQKLISVCRLHRQKNLPMTIDVIDRLKDVFPDIHLDIYGDGDLKESLEAEILKRGLSKHVALKGLTKEVPLRLANSSVFISTSDYEGISNSMLEAMSVGMPIVCTDCPIGGARLMLRGGAGVLTPIRDVNLFVSEVENLLNNPEQAIKLGQKAKEVSLQYSAERITQMWLSVFDRLSS